MLLGGGTAFAKDAIKASVTIPDDQPTPVMTEHGTGYTPGTYAVGDIHLDYVYLGTTFPEGPFATFNLSLAVQPVANGQKTSYPVMLNLTDIGSENVTLSASSPLQVLDLAWTASVPVTISIPSFVAADPLLNEDGDVLVGNLKLEAGNELKTVTNVKVRIRLVASDGLPEGIRLHHGCRSDEYHHLHRSGREQTGQGQLDESRIALSEPDGCQHMWNAGDVRREAIAGSFVLDATEQQSRQCRFHVRHGRRD